MLKLQIPDKKCEAYKRRLLYGSRVSNLGFDILTTIFGALGTVFSPINTVHAFTAATTISSGTKTAIDADIYQNATAPLMVQAISATYDSPMDDLHDKIADSDDTAAHYDLGNVVRIHNRCSLTEALVEVQKLETGNPKPSPVSTPVLDDLAIKNGAQFKLSDGSLIVVTSDKPGNMDQKLTWTLQASAAGSSPVDKKPMSMRDFINMLNTKGATKTP